VITKRLARNADGEPQLTIRVVGAYDIARFAHHLRRGQVEFAEVGGRALRSLRRLIGRRRYLDLEDYLHGGGYFR
jgi:hypothetical protein